MTLYSFCLLQVMSELIKDITRNVAFHYSAKHMAVLCELLKKAQGPHSVRHMAVLCELLKEAQGPHSVLGELKRLVPAQS